MDIIFIEELVIYTTIGIYDWEKKTKQKLIIDIEMMWDSWSLSKQEDLNICLNYSDVSEAIVTFLANNHFLLVERVAEEIANLLMKRFRSPGVYVKVGKPSAIAQAKQVGVKIKRGIISSC
ncbi:dihydroneopterin aldolase [Candidatus Pantoea edessiphila]|uniref:7,8-dihydroneopterin aldolase n=1 Tax=Candidatus Pantoea edessiphila TaxID=2044610 RepID=A0A2P5SXS3_9GAMM|nr:dihydroneopterin aldolase [Candidatus Pantoea edessiphila]MBK4775745.1 dihydroneopterin aldolase [Pantoea sp. Edef]PPI87141.1 dihydroneopterin aldolase [Candidatus Pantoea edessiphila]